VADAPVFEEIRGQVLHALNAPALVAHNAHVDVDVLRRRRGGVLVAGYLERQESSRFTTCATPIMSSARGPLAKIDDQPPTGGPLKM